MKFSGFRILISLKIAYLFIFRIQDPESSESEDPDSKSHEGRKQTLAHPNLFTIESLTIKHYHCHTQPRSDQRHQIWSKFQMFCMVRMLCCITELQLGEEGLVRTLQSWTPATIFHRLNHRYRFPAVFNLVNDIAGIAFTRLFLDQDA